MGEEREGKKQRHRGKKRIKSGKMGRKCPRDIQALILVGNMFSFEFLSSKC